MKPLKILDLFCGAGGAAMGLRQGLDDLGIPHEIYGVDNKPQKRYPFHFVLGDALKPPFDLSPEGCEFDFVWASPKCQDYSITKSISGKRYERQVKQVRAMLLASGKPFTIENVMGAKVDMRGTLMLCGTMFGLRVERHRLFECNPAVWFPPVACGHNGKASGNRAMRANKRVTPSLRDFEYMTIAGHDFLIADARKAMGIDWMGQKEIAQAIPPAYSRYIIKQIFGNQ